MTKITPHFDGVFDRENGIGAMKSLSQVAARIQKLQTSRILRSYNLLTDLVISGYSEELRVYSSPPWTNSAEPM